MSLSNVELGKWVEGHHRVSQEGKNGELVHVYAIAGPPVFGGDPGRWDFDIEFPIWGVTFILKGYVDLTTLEIDATFSVRIPIIGTFKLAEVKGNLKDGVSVSFGISGILSGKATFYVRDGWIWVDLSAEIFGTTYGPVSIKLIPLP
ncbi:hypothetical protein BC834DRAFT_971496 [Gloeopeniophorella convolvens]|nr:hypothetical protein BC834DRAFT_971496 [Gloeopeniophorella convolvens]